MLLRVFSGLFRVVSGCLGLLAVAKGCLQLLRIV